MVFLYGWKEKLLHRQQGSEIEQWDINLLLEKQVISFEEWSQFHISCFMNSRKGRHPQVDKAVLHFVSELLCRKTLTLSVSVRYIRVLNSECKDVLGII